MRWVSVVVSFGMLIAVGCSGGDSEATDWRTECGLDQPSPALMPDDINIANQILAETTDDLMFDRTQRDALATEVQGVLDLVRAQSLSNQDTHVPPQNRLQIGTGFEGRTATTILRRAGSFDSPYEEQTLARAGVVAIDKLTHRFGLLRMLVSPSLTEGQVSVRLCLSDLVNLEPVAEEFRKLDDAVYVETALPGGFSYSGWVPGINMRKDEDTWYVVTITSTGLCQAGLCGKAENSYYRVVGDSLTSVPAEEADAIPIYERVRNLAEIGFGISYE